MTSPDRQPQSRLHGRARNGGAPAPFSSRARGFASKGDAATGTGFEPYLLPVYSCAQYLTGCSYPSTAK